MNTAKIVKKLETSYPGKNIIFNNKENPTEIICEIEPTEEHPDYSIAIAVVDKSKLHYHKKTTEIYEVIKGELTLYKGNKQFELSQGEKMVIKPNEIHWAIGDETWVRVISNPGWQRGDQFYLSPKN